MTRGILLRSIAPPPCELTVEEHAALQAEAQDWRVQIEELERLGQEQGFEAIHPRRPHW